MAGSSRDRFVLAMHQAIKPQHQARNDFDIFADLADRLGYRDRFTEGRNEMQWIKHLYQQRAQPYTGWCSPYGQPDAGRGDYRDRYLVRSRFWQSKAAVGPRRQP